VSDDEDDQLADVVSIHKDRDLQDDDRPLFSDRARQQQEAERATFCPHRRYELDDEKHRVFCRDCKREVDAYAVLHDLARAPERYIGSRREAQRRSKIATGNLEDLLRQERNAKARLRRARTKHEDEIVVTLRGAVPHIDRTSPAGSAAYGAAWSVLTRYERDYQDDVSDEGIPA
jgi:hypothetical protein